MGICFDSKLNFNSQIKKLTESCSNRLNIIKILSHKSWKLNEKTLRNIYLSLIRSVFDYSAILCPAISSSNLYNLQVIQNNALRLILRKPRNTRINELHDSTKIDLIQDRFKTLSARYILKSINNNPIIKQSFDEFTRFSNGRILNTKTLFCPHKNTIYQHQEAFQPVSNTINST